MAKRDLALVVAAQLLVSALAYASGFRAVSDDDYARVVIAQRFAEAPSWDPSGTSWLPLPFQLQGLVFLALGAHLEVARLTAACAGVLASLLLYATARAAGIPRGRAAVGPLVVSALPTFAPLGVATVPEYLTAALLAWGTLSLRGGGLWRVSGAAALLCASASRYEAWPVAGVFAALCLLDAARRRAGRAGFVLSSALALAFPIAWMIHGAVHHGSPTFFVTRVAAYKAAWGGASGLDALVSYPRAWLTREPELAWLSLAALALTLLVKKRPAWIAARVGLSRKTNLSPLLRADLPGTDAGAGASPPKTIELLRRAAEDWGARPLFVGAALIVVLIAGDVRGGAPTHHPERALLLLWILGAFAFLRFSEGLERRALGAIVVGAVLFGIPVRLASERGAYAERSEEEAAGSLVRARLGERTPVVVGTTDFGYFAVEAAAGNPRRFLVAQSHDPRERDEGQPLPLRVAELGRSSGACFAVVPLCVEVPGARTEHETADFQLVRFATPGCAAAQ